MKTYLALLKGVNVGGKKKISMGGLKNELENSGFQSVQTYLNSGNVLFKSDNNNKQLLAEAIEKQILASFELSTAVLILDTQDLENILSLCPWKDLSQMNTSHVFANFLFDNPESINNELIDKYRKDSEELFYFDNVIFMHCPMGMADSKLTTSLFEKATKVNNTARNWNTSTKLLEKMKSL